MKYPQERPSSSKRWWVDGKEFTPTTGPPVGESLWLFQKSDFPDAELLTVIAVQGAKFWVVVDLGPGDFGWAVLRSGAVYKRKFTVFIRQANSQGTTWIGCVKAVDRAEAVSAAMSECAIDWGWEDTRKHDLHILGIAEGDISILEWNDIQ